MRRRRSSVRGRALARRCAFLSLFALPRIVAAQSGVAKEGALFLLIPVGARSVALGDAVVASEPGSEGIWLNPASLARLQKRELAINHSHSVIGDIDALVLVLPQGRAGVISVAAYLLNYGAQENTDRNGNVIGSSNPRNLIFAAAYSATIGRRVRAGVTYKYLQDRQDCSGDCVGIPSHVVGTSAYDIGLQATPDDSGRVTFGLGIRSLGLPLQINDVEQADPLPTRLHAGAEFQVAQVAKFVRGAELRLSGELVSSRTFDQGSLRAGAELLFQKQVALRAGFATGRDAAAGISIGFGYERGGLSFDVARTTGGISSDAGLSPTYVSLRVRF